MGHVLGPVVVVEWSALALILWIALTIGLAWLRVPAAVVVSAVASWLLAGALVAYGPALAGGVDDVVQWVRAVPQLASDLRKP
jgi:hypothetical protein